MLDKSKFEHFFIPVQNGSQSSSDNSQHQQRIWWPKNGYQTNSAVVIQEVL